MYSDLIQKMQEEDYRITDLANYSYDKLGGILLVNNVTNNSDSYGYTDETLERVIHFPTYDCYVRFTGYNQSYSGMEYTKMEEVTPTEQTIQVFKPI